MNIKLLLTLSLIATASLLLSQCNTTEGLGRDIQHVGDRIENTAERANPH